MHDEQANVKAGRLLSRRAFNVLVACLATSATPVFTAGVQAASDYPQKPVRVFVPYGPGGVGDLPMRILADKLSQDLKQQFVIENRPGAGGIVNMTEVLRARSDGYTLGEVGNGQAISMSLLTSRKPGTFASAATSLGVHSKSCLVSVSCSTYWYVELVSLPPMRISGRFCGDAVRPAMPCSFGRISCTTASIDPDRGRARFELARLPEKLGGAADGESVAAALGLAPEEIGFDNFRPSLWSAGISFTYVPVRGLDALKRCEPKLEYWEAAFTRHERSSAYVFCRETVEPSSAFHARMFAPRLGIYEDPATGSAAAAFAGVLHHFMPTGNGSRTVVIEQGYQIGRPSLITLSMTVRDRQLLGAAIGGEAIAVSDGTVEA